MISFHSTFLLLTTLVLLNNHHNNLTSAFTVQRQNYPNHNIQLLSNRRNTCCRDLVSLRLNNIDDENDEVKQSSSSLSSSLSSSWKSQMINVITSDPKRSFQFSLSQTLAGAVLGPFLDTYHSVFGVLQYNHPFTLQLWNNNNNYYYFSHSTNTVPALVTTFWVPLLFGLAGFIISWLYILLDAMFVRHDNNETFRAQGMKNYSPPKILLGISFFTFQYWLSGILYYYNIDREIILSIMSLCAYIGYKSLDNTKSGFITSLATAIGGPIIEVALISLFSDTYHGYHYTDAGETGFFPLWIVPVYFLGGPANGNLARGVWNVLSSSITTTATSTSSSDQINRPKGCKVCNDSRAQPCPNCDANGYYVTYGREVKCNCCKGRGLVICRQCFHLYDEDPSDIEAIRQMMSRLPD